MKETEIYEIIIRLLTEAQAIAHELKKCSEVLLYEAFKYKAGKL